ncbi:uncharacterized protein LOC104585272 isoform X1 [Brachypodium distachyon]|uniref:uncharacterized protein LOC104585272 isoform X1 n=2 Tax=Brachypodium distachyon TaxID=15368 RepID=UPI00071D22EF|nr:uncharacterized protein LOC104585272 isoform X1 [Brachypodium distachyon]|eukprot:XP_014751649.1 uncharacterized protein LOC104585272 isoform X1 [Brachypodium distachyon]
MVNSSPNRLSSPNFALEFLKLDCIGVSRCTAIPNLGLSPLRSRMRPPPFLIRGRRSLPFAPLPFSFEDDAAASEVPAASPRHRYPRRGDAAPFAYPHTRDDRVVSTVKHEKAAKHRRLKISGAQFTCPSWFSDGAKRLPEFLILILLLCRQDQGLRLLCPRHQGQAWVKHPHSQ